MVRDMTTDNYLNKSCNTFDLYFEEACKMSEKNFSHDEIMQMLKSGNIAQKQIAALKTDYIKNNEEAQILLSNLTGCDGKIREAVALTLNRILDGGQTRAIFAPISSNILAEAAIDINANICRLAIECAVKLKGYEDFKKNYTKRILEILNTAFDEMDKFIFRDKKYVINKQVFKIYWCLESLNYFYDAVDSCIIEEILEKSSKQKEYTIREKAAQIVFTSNMFPKLRQILSNDENYYVRNIFS